MYVFVFVVAYIYWILNVMLFVRSALSEEEKVSLRAGLITNFNEPVNQVSLKKDARISSIGNSIFL